MCRRRYQRFGSDYQCCRKNCGHLLVRARNGSNRGAGKDQAQTKKTILIVEQATELAKKRWYNLKDCDVLIANATKLGEVNVVQAAKELKAAFAKTPMEMVQVTAKVGSMEYAFWHCIIAFEKKPGNRRCTYIRKAVARRTVRGYLEWNMMQAYDMAEIIKADESGTELDTVATTFEEFVGKTFKHEFEPKYVRAAQAKLFKAGLHVKL